MVTLACVAASAACYSYTPVVTPQPGMDVRARLKAQAAVSRSQGLDEPILRFDGTVVDVADDALALDVIIARSSSGVQDVVLRDTVRLQRTELDAILQRKLSPGRTALFTIGMAAAAVGVVAGIDQIVGGTGDEPDDGTPPAITVRVHPWVQRLLLSVFR